MKSEIEKLGIEFRGENVGIETLKRVQEVKAKLIKQLHETIEAAQSRKVNAFGIAAAWLDDAWALGEVLGRYKKIALEFEDMDGIEATELKLYFIECLKKQGFDGEDAELLDLAGYINSHVTDTVLLFKKIAIFAKHK